MDLIVLDFETPYGKGYTLQGMTYEEYIFDERFKVFLAGITVNGESLGWLYGDALTQKLHELFPPGNKNVLICHNTMFDGAILSWHYGLSAGMYLCTQGMSRALWNQQSASLDALAKRCFPDDKTKRKGKELANFKDIYELNDAQREILGGYCVQDVALTHDCFWHMNRFFPNDELRILDMTLRLFIHPPFRADISRLSTYKSQLEARRKKAILDSGLPEKTLTSNDKFAEWILEQGIPLEKVPSPTPSNPDNMKWPLSKDDAEFIEIQARYPQFAHVWEGRIQAKSPGELRRTERLLTHASLHHGEVAVPLNYCAAHTLRFGGTNKVNFQNFKRGSEIRYALLAPEGYQVDVQDLSNIEARLLAWFAQESVLLTAYREKQDVYSQFASRVFGYAVNKNDHPTERFVGKTCLAADTKVLTNNGIKYIIDVKLTDMVWDGFSWVQHSGLQYQGISNVMDLHGVSITPDHKIFTGETWIQAGSLAQDVNTLCHALEHAAAHLPSPDMLLAHVEGAKEYSSHVIADDPSTLLTRTTLKTSNPLAVMLAQKLRRAKNVIGSITPRYLTQSTDPAFLTGCHPQLVDAITQTIQATSHTEGGESLCISSGGMTAAPSYGIYRQYLGGMTQALKWIGTTITATMSLAMCVLSRVRRILTTGDRSTHYKPKLNNCKPVYDITNAGKHSRFTILTDAGPLIVHNCILGLGYGVGEAKLQHQLFLAGLDYSLRKCWEMKTLYRTTYRRIPELWRTADAMIAHMFRKDATPMQWGPLVVEHQRIRMPNGLYLNYPGLRMSHDEAGRFTGFEYWNGKHWTNLYGGKLIENIIQCLARILLTSAMLKINDELCIIGGRIALNVHDEVASIIPTDHAKTYDEKIAEILRTPPEWCADGTLVLETEGGYATNYSK